MEQSKAGETRIRVMPADTGEALINPGMGFTHYGNSYTRDS
jgi:hypothetical protein